MSLETSNSSEKLLDPSRRISISLLNALNEPRLFKAKKENLALLNQLDDTSLRIGYALDTLLTSPSEWNKRFIVLDSYKPTGGMEIFIRNLPCDLDENSPSESYENAYKLSCYKRSLDVVVSSFWSNEKLVKYYKDRCMVLKEGLTVLSKDEHDLVLKCASSIEENPFALEYFKGDVIFQSRIEFDIYFLDKKLPAVAVIDGIKIDKENKKIVAFDLKTTSKSVWDFPSSLLYNGYFRQAAFYYEAIKSSASPVKDLLLEGYELEPFVFIVVESKPTALGPVIIYEISDEWIRHGFNGVEINGRYFKGINDLIKDYLWHLETNIFFTTRELYGSRGKIVL